MRTDDDFSSVRPHQPRQGRGQRLAAAAGCADDCHRLARLDLQRRPVQQLDAAFVGDRKIDRRQRKLQSGDVARVDGLNARVDHVVDVELLEDLGIFYVDVLPRLIPVDQVLQRARQILVGGDDRDQLPDIESSLDHLIAAHEIKEKRRNLHEKIVNELYQKLPLVQIVTDLEDAPQPRGDIRPLEIGRVVAVNIGDALGNFADAAGQFTSRKLPLAPQHQQAFTHLRNDEQLQRHDAHGYHSEPQILHEDENQRRRRLASQQGRLHEGIADEAAQWLHFVLHHGGEFRRFYPLELLGWKAQHPVHEFEADAAQHALAEAALVGVDVKLEGAVDDDEQEKNQAEVNERGETVELQTREEIDRPPERQIESQLHVCLRGARRREALALNRAVDDELGQIEREKIGIHGGKNDNQNPDLLIARVPPDVAG